MPLSGDEPICPKFQPNIFDPSRCHDCLRQRHLHTSPGEDTTKGTPQQKPLAEPETSVGIRTGPSGGVLLTPIPSQAEDGDTSSKQDSDGLSVVSSYCDVNGGHVGHEETPLCILSPNCELYICDGDDDDSTDSFCDQSEEFSSSLSAEEEYFPIIRQFTELNMTRLDPPHHRPNPRTWMDEARGRDDFTRHSGLKGDKEKRESGYFSLGRAAGARSLCDKSPPAPFRHFERGHPIFSSRNVEPKDSVPFRNPNLGVASERLIPEFFGEDLAEEIPPPDPYDVAVEVEAQVGPRSPSPTPFKIAESLASSGRKGFSRGNPPPHSSFYQQSGRYESSRRGKDLQPGSLPFRRSESTASLSRQNFDGEGWSQGTAQSRRSPQDTHGRLFESGTLPKNFKSFANSVKTQSSTVSDFRSPIQKSEMNGSLGGMASNSRSSSPSRRDCNSSSQVTFRKSEVTTSLSHERGGSSCASSPSSRISHSLRDDRSSSPRRAYSPPRQSILRKSESIASLNGRSHLGRCGSPIREGYGMESQALFRSSSTRNGLNGQEHEVPIVSPSGRGFDRPGQSILRKSESNTISGRKGQDSRSSSPGRRGHDTISQYQLKRKDFSGSSNAHNCKSRNSSSSRKSCEAPSQSVLSTPEFDRSVRNRDSYSSVALRKGFGVPDQCLPQKSEMGSPLNSRSQHNRSFSPSRKSNNDPPGYSVLRSASNGDSNRSFNRKNTHSELKSDSNRSPHSWRGSTHSLRSSSLSRPSSPSRQAINGNRTAPVTSESPRASGSIRSGASRHSHKDRCPSPTDRRPSGRARSPSPSLQTQMQRHTFSQSSIDSSESGQLSVVSTGRNREEYIMLADVPKAKVIHQKEIPGHMRQSESQQPIRRQERFKPASHSLSKHPSTEWEDAGDTEREWHYGRSGYLSRAHSSMSLQRSASPSADEGSSWKSTHHRSEQMQLFAPRQLSWEHDYLPRVPLK